MRNFSTLVFTSHRRRYIPRPCPSCPHAMLLVVLDVARNYRLILYVSTIFWIFPFMSSVKFRSTLFLLVTALVDVTKSRSGHKLLDTTKLTLVVTTSRTFVTLTSEDTTIFHAHLWGHKKLACVTSLASETNHDWRVQNNRRKFPDFVRFVVDIKQF